MALTSHDIQQMTQIVKDEALNSAAEMGDISDLNALLNAGANPLVGFGIFSKNTLTSAAQNGHLDVVNRLLEFPAVQAQITDSNNSALRSAADNGHLNIVNRLLEFPDVVAQITSLENYALRCAALNGHLNVVNRLLEFPAVVAQITAFDNRALRWAALNGHLDVVNRLLEFPAVVAQITADSNDALNLAAENSHLNVANRLLEFPAVKVAMDDTIRSKLTTLGFYEWQNTQRRQILSTIKGALHQRIVPELIMPILKRIHPSFSDTVLNKQINFGKRELRKAMATHAAPLSFAVPATDSDDKKHKRDESDRYDPTPKRLR